MSVSREDMDVIKSELDERYVLWAKCNKSKNEIGDRISKQNTKLEIATHDLSAIKKGIWLVATASVGSLITALFELLTR